MSFERAPYAGDGASPFVDFRWTLWVGATLAVRLEVGIRGSSPDNPKITGAKNGVGPGVLIL